MVLFFINLNSCYTDSRFNQLGDPLALGSPASVSNCPTGYISVPANSTVGADNDFCVMKYEAKAWLDSNSNEIIDSGEIDSDGCGESDCSTADWASTHKPVSTAEGHPWRQISPKDAWDKCVALNSESSKTDISNDINNDGTYALISNPEWMAIARSIENVSSNWTSGTVGSGCLYQGNSGVFNCTSPDSGYNGPDPDSGSSRNTIASLQLENSEIIWDFSGNVGEVIDWTLSIASFDGVLEANRAYVSTDGGTTINGREFRQLDVQISDSDVMFPETWSPNNVVLDSNNGVGQYISRNPAGSNFGYRGGYWNSTSVTGYAGIYNLILGIHDTSSTGSGMGFRCVYRP
jgi:hypothetical protein